MNNFIKTLICILICFSCQEKNGKKKTTNKTTTDTTQVAIVNTIPTQKKDTRRQKALVLSVEETLIMPSDYLTTAMTLKTEENDTLVFLDMSGFEKLSNQEIDIEYKMVPSSKLLVCSDCTSYSGKIRLYDITSTHSKVQYKHLKLVKYLEDQWITPASIFKMMDEEGVVESYNSNDNNMIADSLKMKKNFIQYGFVTKMHPELINRAELEKLVE
ncbi:hypothetical protein [Wenyingzhuangia sp. IMCC45574]